MCWSTPPEFDRGLKKSRLFSTTVEALSAKAEAGELTVTLLKKWLVEYKFRGWCPPPVPAQQDAFLKERRMEIEGRVRKVLTNVSPEFPKQTELTRLQEFVQRMKQAGILKVRTYDLPLPDTLGRASVLRHRPH